MPLRRLPLILLLTLGGGHAALGQDLEQETRDGDEAGALPVITVSAPRLTRSLYDTPAAVSTLTREEIQRGQQRVRLDEALTPVPGVFLQNRDNFAQGQRIASRGFGARAPFGIRGIHIRVDGIPYTLPDGQAQIDAVDIDSAERIEVIRGPASVLYGNAAGGVLDITTGDGSEMRRSPQLRLQGGSHDYRKLALRHGGESGDWTHSVSFSALDFEGHREQSAVEKRLLNARVGYRLDDTRTLSALVNLLDLPTAEDAGGLTAEEVAQDRRQAVAAAKNLNAGQRVEQQLLGLHYQDLAFADGELNARGFISRRDFEQQLPFPGSSLVNFERLYYGGSVDYTRTVELAGRALRYVAGLEMGRQEDDRGRHSVDPQGNVTARTADEQQNATAVGAFLLAELDLTDELKISAGARHDRVRLSIDDRLPDEGRDEGGQRTFREWNGSLGASYRYRDDHQLYANLGSAFETPTFTEFARPDGGGGFNPELSPQRALNRELGLRGRFDNGLRYDLVAFSVRVDDELLPFEADDGRTYYENAARTSRDGIELGLDWSPSLAWRLTSALTLADYRFDRFSDGQQDFTGNRLPGLPRQQWNNRVTWHGGGERFASLEALYTGGYHADNANRVKVDSHWLFNLRAGDAWRIGGQGRQLGLHLGVRNLLDEEHFANVRINANAGRYFEPAAGRTFYAGLELSF